MKIIAFKNIVVALLLFYCLFITAACPRNAVRQAAKAGFQLSGLTVDVAKGTARAYTSGIIDLQTKDRIAGYLKTVSAGGKKFNALLTVYVRESGEQIPTDKLRILNTVFADEVVAPFLEILTVLKIIPSSKADYLRVAVAALRNSILVISAGFEAQGVQTNRGELNAYA